MHCEPYTEDISLAFCCRLYVCFQTSRRRPQTRLNALTQPVLQELVTKYDLHILDTETTTTEIRCQVSFHPRDMVSAIAGKLKGRISSWVNDETEKGYPSLARGYFACTTGDTTSPVLDRYLEEQSAHHRYADLPLPPVFVQSFPDGDESKTHTAHSVTRLRYHVVLSTCGRRGVFTAREGEAITQAWLTAEESVGLVFQKVSFVPDHVHIAVRARPDTSPLAIVLMLMNTAQELMTAEFAPVLRRYVGDRLWTSGAYIGSFGNFSTGRTRRAMAQWMGDSAAYPT